ncbi:MAG TPA: hypothetical protein VNY24_00560 [Candidatus Acidoferrales bacterium]|nr:hypothetical protein [Candidatus Acidoferrales bacterium]
MENLAPNSPKYNPLPRQTQGSFGPEYQKKFDGRRLNTQMQRVRDLMVQASVRERWLTLGEIRAALEDAWLCRFPEASVSAQLRHLKKPAFGAYRLEKRRRAGPGFGLFEYRLLPPDRPPFAQNELFSSARQA